MINLIISLTVALILAAFLIPIFGSVILLSFYTIFSVIILILNLIFKIPYFIENFPSIIQSVILLSFYTIVSVIKHILKLISKIPYFIENFPSIIQYEYRLLFMRNNHKYSNVNLGSIECSEQATKQRAFLEKQKAIDEETREQVREQMRIRDSKKTYY